MMYLIYTLLVALLIFGTLVLNSSIHKSAVSKRMLTSNNIQAHSRVFDIWDEFDDDDEAEE